MLACAQLGITVASLGLGAVAEPAVADLLEAPFAAARLPEGLRHPVAFALALAVVVYLHVVLGEMVPKNLAIAGPERAALMLAPPLVGVARVVKPLVVVLDAVTRLLLRLLRVEPKEELASAFTAEEVHSIVTESRREGLLDDEEHGLLTGALELAARPAADVMVPLERLVTVPAGSTPQEVERVVARTGFSRLPVADGDELVGYLHVKDLLYADDEAYGLPVPARRVRALVPVPVDEDVEDALVALQRAGAHVARVARRRRRHRRRGVPRGRARGAGRRGQRRDAARAGAPGTPLNRLPGAASELGRAGPARSS